MSKSKELPSNLPVEQAVLGAIMLDRDAYDNAAIGTSSGTFALQRHQDIYEAMVQLNEAQIAIDLLTVMEQMKKNGTLKDAGGPAYLAELTNKVASAANIEYHTRILLQEQLRREAIVMGETAIREGADQTKDPIALVDELEQAMFTITGKFIARNTKNASEVFAALDKQINIARNRKDRLIGLPSGFKTVDDLTGGLQAPDLIILAARPGMGKTAFVLTLAANLAVEEEIPVGFFSLEMSNTQLASRLLSIKAEVNNRVVRGLEEAEPAEILRMQGAMAKLKHAPIFFDDTPGLKITEMRSKARRMVRNNGVQLIIIDYLQLMDGDSGRGNREQEISKISRGVKAMAKELNIPVIALSQLSRAVEVRGGTKRPQLSDLRESGSLEQDADIVAFIYRPEYYQILEDLEGKSTKGHAEIIVAKNRHGQLKNLRMDYIAEFTAFRDKMSTDEWEEVLERTRPELATVAEELLPGQSTDDDNPF